MNLKSILWLFVVFTSFAVQGQTQYRLATEMTRFDFFQGLEIQNCKKAFQPFFGLSCGLNRSIFQLQPYPRLSVGFFYDEEDDEKVQAGPIFMQSISILKVDASIKGYDVYSECYGGLALQYGGKWKVYTRVLAGWLYHKFPSTEGSYSVHSAGFSVGIGLIYSHERD